MAKMAWRRRRAVDAQVPRVEQPPQAPGEADGGAVEQQQPPQAAGEADGAGVEQLCQAESEAVTVADAQASTEAGASAEVADTAECAMSSMSSRGPDIEGDAAPSRKRVYRSPEEILQPLAPPSCTLGLDYNARRFVSAFKKDVNHDDLLPPFSYRTRTASFVSMRTWQEALQEVHRHCWQKWGVLKADLPLPAGQSEQTPGVIPQAALDQMQVVVDRMPEAKDYKKAKRA